MGKSEDKRTLNGPLLSFNSQQEHECGMSVIRRVGSQGPGQLVLSSADFFNSGFVPETMSNVSGASTLTPPSYGNFPQVLWEPKALIFFFLRERAGGDSFWAQHT